MISKNLAKTGSISHIIAGIIFILVFIGLALTPADQITRDADKFITSYSANPVPLTAVCLLLFIGGLLAFGSVVESTADLFEEKNESLTRLGKNIGKLSVAVTSIGFSAFLLTTYAVTESYTAGSAATKMIITAIWNPILFFKWISLFAFGTLGLWVAIVGILVFTKGVLPKNYVIICVLKSGGFWICLAGFMLENILMLKIGAVIGILIGGSLYHIWQGIFLGRLAKSLPNE